MQPSLHPAYIEPQRAAKVGVSSQAAENLERSRGTLVIIGSDNNGDISSRSVYVPRVIGKQGADIVQRSYGTVGKLFVMDGAGINGNITNRGESDVVVPRVKGVDGEDILRRSVNGTMGTLLNVDENRMYCSPRPAPRIPTDEAEANAMRSRGVMVKVLDTAANREYRSARHCGPRVNSGAGETNALNGRGTMSVVLAHTATVEQQRADMTSLDFDQRAADEQPTNRRSVIGKALSGQLPGSPAGDVRVKGNSGLKNYELGTRGVIGPLLGADKGQQCMNGTGDVVARPPPRVNGRGTDIAEYGKTGTLHRLLNTYGQLPQSGRPPPRVKPEARQTALNGTGKNMAEYVNPRRKPAKRPTRTKLGLNKKPRPTTSAYAFGRTLDRQTIANITNSRPSTA